MKKTSDNQMLVKGDIFWFDPLKETKIGSSPLAMVLSGRLQNKYGDHVVIITAGSKATLEVRDFFEVVCELENIKLKIILFAIHSMGKEFFLEKAKYLGRLEKKTVKKIDEKIKLILELDS